MWPIRKKKKKKEQEKQQSEYEKWVNYYAQEQKRILYEIEMEKLKQIAVSGRPTLSTKISPSTSPYYQAYYPYASTSASVPVSIAQRLLQTLREKGLEQVIEEPQEQHTQEPCVYCGEMFENTTQREFHEQHCAD